MSATVLAFHNSPPSHVVKALNEKDWPRLLKIIEEGFPVNAVWKGLGTFFECFVVSASAYGQSDFKEIQIQKRIVKTCIEKGLEQIPEYAGFRCSLPVTVASFCGRIDFLEIFDEYQWSFQVGDKNYYSPLQAIGVGFPSGKGTKPIAVSRIKKCLMYLKEKGVDLSSPLPNGEDPLLWSARHSNQSVVSLLIELGANVSVQQSRFIAYHCIEKNDADLFYWMIEQGFFDRFSEECLVSISTCIAKHGRLNLLNGLWKKWGSWNPYIALIIEKMVEDDKVSVLVWCIDRVYLSHVMTSRGITFLDWAIDCKSNKCLFFISDIESGSVYISPYEVNSLTHETGVQRAIRLHGLKYVKEQLGWSIPLRIVN